MSSPLSRTGGDGKGAVRPLVSKAERSARDAFVDFVEEMRRINNLNVADWDAPRWDFPKRSRASSASEGGLVFSLRSANTPDPGVFPEPFMSFVKAVVCAYNVRSQQPYAVGQSQTIIAAARLLYDGIRDRGGDPLSLRHGDFDAAANKACAAMGAGAANVGSKLAIISEEMDRYGLTPVKIGWRNSIRREHKHDRVGPEATRRRHAKLPSIAALDALAEISARTDLDDRDLIVQRTIDLLVCGGFRINEVLTIPRNALIEEAVLDDAGVEMLDLHGRPAVRVGIRYWPEKGGHEVAQIKWLPTVMIDLARRAMADVLRITAPYAEVALHQSSNLGSTLLGDPWDGMPDDALLTAADIARAVGLSAKGPSSAGNQFIKANGLPAITESQGVKHVLKTRLGDLRQLLWQRSTHGNVLNGVAGKLDVSASLFVIPLFYVKRSLACGMRGTVQLLSDAMVQVYLVSQANGIQPSIFERLGYRDDAGDPLRLNSHQFRHLLNTLAAEGSVSELEIARWMGRTKIGQNSAYQHVTPIARAESLRERYRAGQAMGPVADHAARIRDPIRREAFIMSTTATAHVTDFGLCVHPWDALPCVEHGACPTCPEHRVIKGDPASRARTAADLEQTDALLDLARAEADDGTYGADNWLAAHVRTADSLRRIIAVHDDSMIPDGTVVQLPKHPPVLSNAHDA